MPEAVNPQAQPKVLSRTWFAWPNAALACEMLGAYAPERKNHPPVTLPPDYLDHHP